MFRRSSRVRPIRGGGVDAALALALRDPAGNALSGSRLRELRATGSAGAEFSAIGDELTPSGVLWHGVNISPIGASEEALAEFGRHLAQRPRRSSSIVGPSHEVRPLWAAMDGAWEAAVREYRWSQPLLLADEELPDLGDVGLRPARPGEEPMVFPAAVAMFREEVGIDPVRGDGGRAYSSRVADLVRSGRSYIVVERGQVLFKADVGAVFGSVAQVHGVWVRPAYRGRGLARAAMAQLVEQVRRDHAPKVSLYVNDFNEPARRAYAAAGFQRIGELATILF
ncbi:GNAT family N-acetyltransferase [Brachybacterium sp. DNPG3]